LNKTVECVNNVSVGKTMNLLFINIAMHAHTLITSLLSTRSTQSTRSTHSNDDN